MAQYIYLALGIVLLLIWLILLIAGKKYKYLVENLDSGEFPLKGIYGVGFVFGQSRVFALRGKLREVLIGQAKLLYDPQYGEYYATVVWAQALTFIHISLAIGFLLAGLLEDGALMILIGVVIAAFLGFYFLNHMNDKLKTRSVECTAELPEVVSTMALLINAGMMLRNAWQIIANSKEGTIYQLMKNACSDMENGISEADAIHKFGRMTNSSEVRKFTSALAQSIEHGGGELNNFLGRQSIEIWALKKQLMLQKGEAAASKLLIPTALLFIGIIIAVIAGAIGMLI